MKAPILRKRVLQKGNGVYYLCQDITHNLWDYIGRLINVNLI